MNKSVQDNVQTAIEDMTKEEVRFLRFLLGKGIDLIEAGEEQQGNAWIKCAVTRVLRFLRDHEIAEIP